MMLLIAEKLVRFEKHTSQAITDFLAIHIERKPWTKWHRRRLGGQVVAGNRLSHFLLKANRHDFVIQQCSPNPTFELSNINKLGGLRSLRAV